MYWVSNKFSVNGQNFLKTDTYLLLNSMGQFINPFLHEIKMG